MGQGELDNAKASFETVSVEMPDLYLYSLFQTGKILRAQEDYPGMADHFQSFLDDDTSPKTRVSEALYWLGWAYQQEERIDLAYSVFEDALATYGNDTAAGETQSILQALEKLKKRQATGPIDHSSPLVGAEDFKSWLTIEMGKAEEEQRLIYLSRLVLYHNSRYQKEVAGGSSLLRLADIVPIRTAGP
jgi:tetratricopeptide (TPR) repeat protein